MACELRRTQSTAILYKIYKKKNKNMIKKK